MNIGTDSPGYANSFRNSPQISWEVIKRCFSEKEPLFYVLQSLICSITRSYTIWFLLIAVIYMVPISYFVYKYSEMPYISFILFMSMAYMNFAMAGLRQTLAAAFLAIAFNYIFGKKYIKFVIFVLLASGFHITSLIFILVLFITKKRIKIWHIIFLIVAIGFCFIFGKSIVSYITDFVFGNTRNYSNTEFGGYSTLILFIVIVIAALIFNKKIYSKEENNDDAFFLKFLLLSIPFQVMAVYQANFFRIAMYFSIFGVLTIIPKALSAQRDRATKLIGITATLILIFVQLFAVTYFVNDVNPYEFFWQVF